MRAIWQHLYSSDNAVDIGTLFNAMSILENCQIGNEPFSDYYASSDFVDKYTVAYIVCGGLRHFGMGTRDGDVKKNLPDGAVTYEYIKDQAKQFVEEFVRIRFIDVDGDAPRSLNLVCMYCYRKFKSRISALVKHEVNEHGHHMLDDDIENPHSDPVYNYTCVSITLCLLRWEHNDAISYGDGERILMCDKLLTLIYRVSRCPKYAHAMIENQCQASILLSPRDAELFVWNRTVNHKGDPNTNFPNDQDLEHQNLVFKTEAKTYRGKLTDRTRNRVSKSAQATNDIAKNYDRMTQVFRPSGVHALPDWSSDIDKLLRGMKAKDLFTEKPGVRKRKAMNTPSPDVLHKLSTKDLKAWMKSCFETFGRKHFYKY